VLYSEALDEVGYKCQFCVFMVDPLASYMYNAGILTIQLQTQTNTMAPENQCSFNLWPRDAEIKTCLHDCRLRWNKKSRMRCPQRQRDPSFRCVWAHPLCSRWAGEAY